jgi:hypothetical protein
LVGRGPADFVLALALVHHLVIAGNVPLAQVAQWLAMIGKAGVIEFVPKSDPMAQRLLATRKDVYANYTESEFQAALLGHYQIEERHPLPGSARVLYRVKRSHSHRVTA